MWPRSRTEGILAKMAIVLDNLNAEVARAVDLGSKAVALLQKLEAQIAAIPASTDPVTQQAIDGLTATLKASDDVVSAEITKDSA